MNGMESIIPWAFDSGMLLAGNEQEKQALIT